MRLPTYQANRVQVQQMPSFRVSTNVDPGAYGVGLGAGMASLGESIAKKERYERDQADDAALSQARAYMDNWDAMEIHGKFAGLSGKAAIDASQPTLSERKKYRDQIAQSLSPRQRERFNREMLVRDLAAQRAVELRTIEAGHEHDDAMHALSGESFMTKVSAAAPTSVRFAPGDVSRLEPAIGLRTDETDLMLAMRLQEIDDYYDVNEGRLPAGAREEAVAAAMSDAHVAVIESLSAQGMDDKAMAYFEAKKGEIAADRRTKIQAKVTQLANDKSVERAVGVAYHLNFPPSAFDPPLPTEEPGPTLSQRLDVAYKQIDASGMDPKLAKKAKEQLEQSVAEQDRKAEVARTQLGEQYAAEIVGGAPWSEMSSKAAELGPKWNAALYNAYRNRGDMVATDPDSYHTWETMAHADPGAFMRLDFALFEAEGRINSGDRAHFEAYKKAIDNQRSGSGQSAPGILNAGEVVTQRLSEYFGSDAGMEGDEFKARREERGNVMMAAHRIIAERQANGINVDAEMADRIMDDLLGEVVYTEPGIFWDSKTAGTAYELFEEPGIDPTDLADAIAFVRFKNPGSPVDVEAVRAVLAGKISGGRTGAARPQTAPPPSADPLFLRQLQRETP